MQDRMLAQKTHHGPGSLAELDCPGQADLGNPASSASSCAHRSVSKDGRIVCGKVVEGENEVSPNVCRACPAKAVNCTHLRFSLRQSVPSPLIVRYNGRTEVWDDDPPELCFERAACDAQVMPIHSPRACAGCSLRQPQWAVREPPVRRGRASSGSNRGVKGGGRVVPFPGREAVAATG